MGSYLIENLLGLAKTPVYNDYHIPVEDGSAPIICRYHFLPYLLLLPLQVSFLTLLTIVTMVTVYVTIVTMVTV